jgi:hypothetical protein
MYDESNEKYEREILKKKRKLSEAIKRTREKGKGKKRSRLRV